MRDDLTGLLKNLAVIVALCTRAAAAPATKRPAAPPKQRPAKAAPKAPTPLSLGDTIRVNGQLFTITVGLTPVTETPPPPPPPVPTLTGYSPNPVAGGQPFSLLGSGFTDASATATWNGLTLPLLPTSATSLSATAPAVTQAASAPVILTTNGTRLVGPNLTVTPSGGPPPPLGWIDGYRNSRRDWTLACTEGDLLFIDGGGFGAAPGSVLLDQTIRAAVVSWSANEVAITVPHVASVPHVPSVTLLSPAGTLLAAQNNGAITISPKTLPVPGSVPRSGPD